MADAASLRAPDGATGCLVLATGEVVWGRGFGAEGTAVGEVCFHTAMTGYQEIMTDPSFAGQIITHKGGYPISMVRDAVVGPVVMVGAGGVETDVRADRVHLVTPITERDARRALRLLRIWPLLDGFRGAEPVDVDALVRLLTAVGRLVDDVPEVAELDLNPVVVTPAGAAIVDIKVRLAAHLGPAGDVARQLRRRAPSG